MKATCYHIDGHKKVGYHNYGSVVAVIIQCNNCKEYYDNPEEPSEEGAVKEMLNDPYEIDITGFKIES